jgi:hypothetical protein
MRPFVSPSGSREDDHLKGSARVSCSQRVDETVDLSIWFSSRRSTGRQAGTEREISAGREHLGSATNDLSLLGSMSEVGAKVVSVSVSFPKCTLHASIAFLIPIARHAAMVG